MEDESGERAPSGDLIREYLQYSAHPLETVLLRGVGPLLGHHHDPFIVEHGDGEHGYPETRSSHT